MGDITNAILQGQNQLASQRLADELKWQGQLRDIERQKQAISGGLQALFPDQQVPFIDESKTMGTMDDPLYAMTQYDPMMFVKNLKGIDPTRADALAGAYVADQTGSNEFGKALLSTFFPKSTGEDPAVVKIADQIAAGMGFSRGTPEYSALVATVAKNPTTFNLGNQQFVSNPILDQAVRSLQEKAKKDSKGNPIYTDADKKAIERINSIAAMTGAQRYDIELSPDKELGYVEQAKRAEEDQKLMSAQIEEWGKAASAIDASSYNIANAIQILKDPDAPWTGPIGKLLPNFKDSAVALQNFIDNQAINVIALGKFGSLSEPELKFSLAVDIPAGMRGPELIKFLEAKIAAQNKLKQAIYKAVELSKQKDPKTGRMKTLSDIISAKASGELKSGYEKNNKDPLGLFGGQ